MREKKKMEVKSLISNKIMDIIKKLENDIQNKPTSMDYWDKNKEILMYDDRFFILINNQNIYHLKKAKKNLYFLIIK